MIRTLILSFLFSFTFAQTEALDYMKNLESDNEKIMSETWNLMQRIARSESALTVESQRLILAESIYNALNKVKSLPDFKGDIAYRDSSVNYLQFNLDVITGRTDALVDMEKIAYTSFDAMEGYINYQNELNRLIQEKNEMVRQQQKLFAEKNNINLIVEKSELNEKIRIGGQVLDNKNDYFLAFYRCSIFEENLFNQLQENQEASNLIAAETMLLEKIRESRDQLATIQAYANDESLKLASEQALDFFEREATELLLPMSEFREQKKLFEKETEKIDQLKPEERTKELVNSYNQKVKEINEASQRINQLSAQFNQERNQIYTNWNTTANNFVNNHMPN